MIELLSKLFNDYLPYHDLIYVIILYLSSVSCHITLTLYIRDIHI